MGTKQRAQRRNKSALPGSMKGQPRSQKQLNQSIFVPELDPSSRAKSLQAWGKFSSPPTGPHGFSMSDEARNTDRQARFWDSSTSLRSQGITFVSAGTLKREEDAWNTVSEENTPQKQSDAEQEELPAQTEAEETVTVSLDIEKSVVESRDPKVISDQDESAADDDAGTSSDGEEEIVFSGRAAGSQLPSRRPTPAPPQPVRDQIQPEPPPKCVQLQKEKTIEPPEPTDTTAKHVMPLPRFATSTVIGLDSPMEKTTLSRRPKRKSKLPFGHFDEDELMQDYIDNMAINDSDDEEEDSPGQGARRKPFKKTETFRMFNGDGIANEKVQTNGKSTGPRRFPVQAIDWDSDELADFDDLRTTDEEVEDIGQIIRHRSRASGAQYLVIATGAEASDAKWILHSKLVSESAVKEIQIYEEIRKMKIEESDLDDDDEDNESEEDEDEEALQDLIDTIESEDDENARIMNYTARMTDEQIARALAKQEELGLGSDELMLFDGEAAEGEEPADDEFGPGHDFIPFNLGKHTSNRGRSKRNKKQQDSFPSAEAFADALEQDPYGAFDIMDFDRPSLRPKKKGRKSDFPWDLGDLDEELKDQLVNTWTKDREKKAERKRQKEEARLAASLTAENGNDPSVVKARIRQFLVQDVDTLRLSPMDRDLRASVHRLAKALSLLSKSEGKDGVGSGRYPILTKTPRTPCYSIETIWQVDALLNTNKYFPKYLFGRSKRNMKASRVAGHARRGGGGIMSGATYRDGEIVGASAPEIGSDNKGRAMLEKMGWTAGMAIGAEGNKGSLDHIRHIVKTSKAGLG